VVHYCVANMPGAVPYTSTWALTNTTLAYAVELADKGVLAAAKANKALARGVNTLEGHVTYGSVAEAHNLEYTPLERLLG
jgi:alanine dehydrogenase